MERIRMSLRVMVAASCLSICCATGALAAPFAVTFRNAATVLLVDLATVRHTGATVVYEHIMIVRPSPDLANGELSHLLEEHEARCADGKVRRLAVAPVVNKGPALPKALIQDDPWVDARPEELTAVCGAAPRSAETVATIAKARKLLSRQD
jgi:hypothetical protein